MGPHKSQPYVMKKARATKSAFGIVILHIKSAILNQITDQ
jgi:hypothetical protein